MRILPSILAHAAQATLLVSDYHNTGSQLASAFEELTFASPFALFGTREFPNVFVNEAGAVSFDKEFVSIIQGNWSFKNLTK